MSDKQFEECTLEEATHVEVNGKVHLLENDKIALEYYHDKCIGIRWWDTDTFIPEELFSTLGIKPMKEKKREPVEFEAIVRLTAGGDLDLLGNIPEGVPLGTKFKCVQILDGEEMTLEEALERNKFLEKALKGAIWLAQIEQVRWNGKPLQALETSPMLETCNFEDEPELAEYIMEDNK